MRVIGPMLVITSLLLRGQGRRDMGQSEGQAKTNKQDTERRLESIECGVCRACPEERLCRQGFKFSGSDTEATKSHVRNAWNPLH